MNQVAYILQPGKLGDIIICSTIANYYHQKGFKIKWPVFDNFIPVIERFDFVEPVSFGCMLPSSQYFTNKKRVEFWQQGAKSLNEISDNSISSTAKNSINFFNKFYEVTREANCKVIDPCFSFPGHTNYSTNIKIQNFRKENRNWIDLKFSLADVPLRQRWNFNFNRNYKKEQNLLDFIKSYSRKKYGSEKFNLVHTYSSLKIPDNLENVINFSYIKGYEIFDWYKVIQESESIYCVDSSLCNFIEVIPEFKEKNKFYLGSEESHYHSYMRNILLNNWVNLSNEKDIKYSGFLDE